MVIFDRFHLYLYPNENDLTLENDEPATAKHVWYLDWLLCDSWIFKNPMELGHVAVRDNAIPILITSRVMVVVSLPFPWKTPSQIVRELAVSTNVRCHAWITATILVWLKRKQGNAKRSDIRRSTEGCCHVTRLQSIKL